MSSTWDQFYHAFEQRFRGSSEAIRERLFTRYHSLLRERLQGLPTRRALDLGCGKGEFLALNAALELDAVGIDASPAAVAYCRNQGFNAEEGDALSFMQKCETGSLALVSTLHVVEHLGPQDTFHWLAESARILTPGGILLIETPSALSLWAGTRQFPLDPTHTHPVHPDYLSFALEYLGFSKVEQLHFGAVEHPERPDEKVLRKALGNPAMNELGKSLNWLYGPMDFACLAQR